MSEIARLIALSALFVAASAGIGVKQRGARACPRHARVAGLLAPALAVACFLTGLALAALALSGAQ